MSKYTIVIKKNDDTWAIQPYWFVIQARNGRTVATSETYVKKASCKKTACKIASAFTEMARVVDKTGE